MTGAELKEKRKARGLTQMDLAYALSLDRGRLTISDWEREKYKIAPHRVTELNHIFNKIKPKQ